jgi:ATP-dependent helicase/nuclease subunit A
VAPGHLFVVGDPKQSIYRFRRADISTFLAAAERFGAEGGGVVELTANFRTVRPVIEWVNTTFATLMAEPDDVDLPVPSQPRYVALEPTRRHPPPGARRWRSSGATSIPPEDGADDLRAAEADEVAATVARALDEGWDVDDGGGGWRPARLGDITVLVPARTSLPFLEDAFDAAGIPFRAESSSLVYASRAVRDLLMVLRAVDDPTDHLRSPCPPCGPRCSACGDDDLFRFKAERRGRWSYLADQPETVPRRSRPGGLAYLRSLYDQRHWLAPSELLDRIARPPGHGARLRRGPAPRRLAPVALRHRPGPGLERGHRGQPAPVPALGGLQTAEGARVAEPSCPRATTTPCAS